MEMYLIIAALLALIVFCVVCIYMISTLRRVGDLMLEMSSAIDDTKRLSAEIQRSLPQALTMITDVSSQATSTLQNVDNHLNNLGEGIDHFRQIGQRVNELEAKIHHKVEGPLLQTASLVAGVSKAISVFVNGVRKR